MTRPLTWKRLLAVPAALTLALGGAVLTAAPATAAPLDPVTITAPVDGTVSAVRTVAVSGTGSDGDVVTVSAESDAFSPVDVIVPAGGIWNTSVTFPDTAAAAQTIVADQIAADDTATTDSVAVIIPAPVVPVVPFLVTSPADGADIPSRLVEFEGTAPAGATITVTVNGEEGFGSVFAEDDGTFAFPGFFPFELGTDVTVVVNATDTEGNELTPETLQLSLLEPIAAPVITSPASGAVITGGTVTFSGTGIAGNTVVVIVAPDEATATAILANPDFDITALVPTVVVGADGRWTVSTTLPLGGYTAAALHTETPITDVDSEVLSLPSNEVAFSLVAPVVRRQLAATGPVSGGFAAPGALVILAGLGMVIASRRRTTIATAV